MTQLYRYFNLFLLTFYSLFSITAIAEVKEVEIALRAHHDAKNDLNRWQPTADYLTKKIPGYKFIMVPYETNGALNQAVSQGVHDFILTNPAAAVEHIIQYKTQPLATLINKRQGKGYSKFGSVIFTRSDRDDINALHHLRGKDVIAVDELGFGGWRIAWKEFLDNNINPYKDFNNLSFAGGSQPRVVEEVANRKVDAGVVRTDMLERLSAEGKINLADFKVLAKKQTDNFPFLHSTRLYPEWLFSTKPNIENKLKSKVVVALLSISENDLAAQKGNYVGWTSPLDYSSVDQLLKELKTGPYDIAKMGTVESFTSQYLHIFLIISIIILSLIFIVIYMVRLNQRVLNTQLALKDEMDTRIRAETVLSSLAEQSLEFTKEPTFFNECIKNLSELFGTKFAFIGLFANPEKTKIKTYKVYAGGKFVENFEYDLEGTPCQDVLDLKEELIGDSAAKRYPDDELLIQMGIESYFGTPLISPNGLMMGLVSVMDTKPLQPDESTRPILKIFANRIALEMQRKEEEEQLQGMAKQLSYQATHDSLTGLVNRQEFEKRISNAWHTATKNNEQHALCYLDLDQFKVVNDTCGHLAGDELLKQLTTVLNSIVRSSDTLARLGGDEFGILLQDCPIDRAEEIAEKFLDSIKNFRFVWEDNVFELGASIGLVPITNNSQGVYQLLQAADSACYVAKDLGRNRVHVSKEDDVAVASHQGEMRWISEITRALQNDDFILHRQEIRPINMDSSPSEHYEVLIRLRDEKGEIHSPGSFIGAAERYNLMYSVDQWVIENSFAYISEQYSKKEQNEANILYAINLSGLSVNNEKLPGFIDDMLNKYDISPNAICFELTETAAISSFNQAAEFINSMKRKGFCFALDDFGTGLCSYAYLRNLPVNYLKIDGRFVSGLLSDPMNRAILESIVHIARVMKVHTIAEWVESEEVYNELELLGVNYIQGYLIGEPEPFQID